MKSLPKTHLYNVHLLLLYCVIVYDHACHLGHPSHLMIPAASLLIMSFNCAQLRIIHVCFIYNILVSPVFYVMYISFSDDLRRFRITICQKLINAHYSSNRHKNVIDIHYALPISYNFHILFIIQLKTLWFDLPQFLWIIIMINFLHFTLNWQKFIKVVKRHFKMAFSCFMFINNYKLNLSKEAK